VLLVLVKCLVTVEITSKEVSMYFVTYDIHTTLTPVRCRQRRRSLGLPTRLAVGKTAVKIKGLKTAFGLKTNQQ